MALQSDPSGFLTGEVLQDIRRAVDLLETISNNIADIKQKLSAVLINPVNPGRLRTELPLLNQTDAPQRQRRSRISNRTRPVRDESSPRIRTERTLSDQLNTEDPSPVNRQRNGLGRFSTDTPRPENNRDGRGRFASNTEESDNRREQTLFNGLGDRITGAVIDAQSNLENVDPTIKAFNEVAEPLAKGYQVIFGDNKDDNRWFKKIFGEIRLFRRDDTAFNRAANRSLHNLENQSETEEGGSGQSFLGGLFGSIIGALAGIGPMLLTGVTTVLGTVFGPIGLAIGGAALAAWGLFSEDGKKFFARIAEDLYLGWSDLTQKIESTWDKGVKIFSDVWEPIKKWFDDKLGIVSDTFNKAGNAANEAVKKVTGVDVKQTAKSGYSKAVDFTSRKVIEPIADAANWMLGKTSKQFESGKGGAGTVSSGKGDRGGASYGTYQLSSKAGTLQNFLKSTKYGATFGDMQPGTQDFNDRWKQLAKMDSDFGKAQHDFIKSTHYDKQMEVLNKSGIDLSNRGAAVKDSVWSTSTQFGPDSSLIKNALKGKDVNKLTDEQIVSAIQDYKIENNDQLFKSSSSGVKEGTLNRAYKEKASLLGLAQATSKPPIQVAQASQVTIPSAKIPSMPPVESVQESPGVTMPMASGTDNKFVSLNIPSQDVGQDLADRKIALLVTGGYSAS